MNIGFFTPCAHCTRRVELPFCSCEDTSRTRITHCALFEHAHDERLLCAPCKTSTLIAQLRQQIEIEQANRVRWEARVKELEARNDRARDVLEGKV